MLDTPEGRYREAWRNEIPERIVDCTMRFVWSAIGVGLVAIAFLAILFVQDARLLH